MIEQVLFTIPGERVNRPDFGCGLLQLVFAPNSDTLAAAVQMTVHSSLQQWLGDRIVVEGVNVEHHERHALRRRVQYIIRRGQERRLTRFTQGCAMNRQFRSDNPRRLQLLRDQNPVGKNGIDFVEITSVDQRSLRVVCVHPVIAALTAPTFALKAVSGSPASCWLPNQCINGREIRLKVDQAGDFSWYTLSLIDPADKPMPRPRASISVCPPSASISRPAAPPNSTAPRSTTARPSLRQNLASTIWPRTTTASAA
jgi:phage baseplate assembly protein W